MPTGRCTRFEQVLRESRVHDGRPNVPNPHEHRYNHQFDWLERFYDGSWTWSRFLPLDGVPED